MKRVVEFILFFYMLSASLFGSDMDAKMEAIRQAPPQERAAMMNALKREIATMNQTQRNEAIRSLESQRKTQQQSSSQFQNRALTSSKELHQLQGQNQQQAGAQYMKNKTHTQTQMKFSR